MTSSPRLVELETALGYSFRRRSFLEAALVHRSYTAEHIDVEDNERLEFLGDAVLQLSVTDHLFEVYPELREGELAKVRAACVNRETLAVMAKILGLGPHMMIGLGERNSGGHEKDSILADAMEAILAAVYLDSDFPTARRVVLDLWVPIIAEKARAPGNLDFKTRLQELLASTGRTPRYEMVDSGPDHAKSFDAVVSVDGVDLGRGSGRSKKEAQQEAARIALESQQT